jgi:putative ABC transport system permease protein
MAALAVAMGLNVLIFSFTSPVLFKALPYPEPDRLLDVSMAPPGKPEAKGAVSPGLYLLLRDKTSAAFEAVGAFDAGRSANLAGDATGPAERLDGHRISATGLAALGTRPLIGRVPTAAEEHASAAPTMVPTGVAATLWPPGRGQLQREGRWPANTDPGVMPEGFALDNFDARSRSASNRPRTGNTTQPSRSRSLEARSLHDSGTSRRETRSRRVRAEVPEP